MATTLTVTTIIGISPELDSINRLIATSEKALATDFLASPPTFQTFKIPPLASIDELMHYAASHNFQTGALEECLRFQLRGDEHAKADEPNPAGFLNCQYAVILRSAIVPASASDPLPAYCTQSLIEQFPDMLFMWRTELGGTSGFEKTDGKLGPNMADKVFWQRLWNKSRYEDFLDLFGQIPPDPVDETEDFGIAGDEIDDEDDLSVSNDNNYEPDEAIRQVN